MADEATENVAGAISQSQPFEDQSSSARRNTSAAKRATQTPRYFAISSGWAFSCVLLISPQFSSFTLSSLWEDITGLTADTPRQFTKKRDVYFYNLYANYNYGKGMGKSLQSLNTGFVYQF